MTDSKGEVVWRGYISPFGDSATGEGSVEEAVKFTGKELDPETGLYYFNARWYDPVLGRFTTEDPARDGVNWYAYVGHNPLRFIDPTGLANWDAVADGSVKMAQGAFKVTAGLAAIGTSGGITAFSGGATAPLSTLGIIVGSTFVVDGFVKTNIGIAEVITGLMDNNDQAVTYDNPDSMSEILGFAGDGVIEGLTGKESDILQDMGEWIGGQPTDTLDLLLSPPDIGAPTLDGLDSNVSELFELNTDLLGGE